MEYLQHIEIQEYLKWLIPPAAVCLLLRVSTGAWRIFRFSRIQTAGFPRNPAIHRHKTRDAWIVRGKFLSSRAAPKVFAAAGFLKSISIVSAIVLAISFLDVPELSWLYQERWKAGIGILALFAACGDRTAVRLIGKSIAGRRFSVLRTNSYSLLCTSRFGIPIPWPYRMDESSEITAFTEKSAKDDFRIVVQFGPFNPVVLAEINGERDAKVISNAFAALAELRARQSGLDQDRIKNLNTRNFERGRTNARAE